MARPNTSVFLNQTFSIRVLSSAVLNYQKYFIRLKTNRASLLPTVKTVEYDKLFIFLNERSLRSGVLRSQTQQTQKASIEFHSSSVPLMEEARIAEQRLKAALHFTIGKLGEQIGEELDVHISRSVLAAVTELASDHLKVVVEDLEAFSRHAKRSTIQSDDVKLIARRNPKLHERLCTLSSSATSEERRKRKDASEQPPKKKKKTNEPEPYIV